MNIILLIMVFLHAASYSCFNLDRNVSDLSQKNSTYTEGLLRAGRIPNPFIYDYNERLRIIAYHGGASHRHPNPAVSPLNWRYAISQAGINALALQQQGHAQGQDHVAGNSFTYEDSLRRPGPHPGAEPRRIRFEIEGPHNFMLRYDDIHIVLIALNEYATIFERGTKNDQIRMCTFTLIWHYEYWHEISQGSVNVIDSPSSIIESTA